MYLSGRQTLKPWGSNAYFSFENNQSLAAKPPTKNMHYKSCEEHMFFIDWYHTNMSSWEALRCSSAAFKMHCMDGSKNNATSDLKMWSCLSTPTNASEEQTYPSILSISTFTVYFFGLVQAVARLKWWESDKSESQAKILKKPVFLRYMERQKSDRKP